MGRAIAYFKCEAASQEVDHVIQNIDWGRNVPRGLEIGFVDQHSFEDVAGNSQTARRIARDAREAGMNYAFYGVQPGAPSKDIAECLGHVLNQASQLFYDNPRDFRGAVFYNNYGRYHSLP